MSRPRKNKATPSDRRTPMDYVGPDFSTQEARQSYIDEYKASGILLEHDAPYWPVYPYPDSVSNAKFAASERLRNIVHSTVDPSNEYPVLASTVGYLLVGQADDKIRKVVGDSIVNVLENWTSDEIETMFKRIVTLKRNEENPHRIREVSLAYSDFFRECGFEPTKPRLKKFIVANSERYKRMPHADDKKAWTRLWKSSGLFTLPG